MQISLTSSNINSLSLSDSNSCLVLTGGPLIKFSVEVFSEPGSCKKVGVPSNVVETIGRKKQPLLSNSCADIFLTGVVVPELSALGQELEPDAPIIVECIVETIMETMSKNI